MFSAEKSEHLSLSDKSTWLCIPNPFLHGPACDPQVTLHKHLGVYITNVIFPGVYIMTMCSHPAPARSEYWKDFIESFTLLHPATHLYYRKLSKTWVCLSRVERRYYDQAHKTRRLNPPQHWHSFYKARRPICISHTSSSFFFFKNKLGIAPPYLQSLLATLSSCISG